MFKVNRWLPFQMCLVHVPHFLLQLELLQIQTSFSLASIPPGKNVAKKVTYTFTTKAFIQPQMLSTIPQKKNTMS